MARAGSKEFRCLFDLIHLIKQETYFTKNHKSFLNRKLILTNGPYSFQHAKASETGLSDFHKLTSTFFKCQCFRLKPKVIVKEITKTSMSLVS